MRVIESASLAGSETLCAYYSREIPEETANPDGLGTTARWGRR